MKFRDAQKDLQKHGMVLKKTGFGNEHRVNHRGGKEETAYYTDDLEDAHKSGRLMSEHQKKEWKQ